LPASVAIDSKHWRKRAEKARDLADSMSDPLAKELMLGIAKDYEFLAREPSNEKIWPQNHKRGDPTRRAEGVAQRMSVRGPYTNPPSKHGRRTCKGPVHRPAWSAQALVAVSSCRVRRQQVTQREPQGRSVGSGNY
jgi:hypothetical protein